MIIRKEIATFLLLTACGVGGALLIAAPGKVLAQVLAKPDEKRQATVIKNPALEVKPAATKPDRPRGEYLYIWEDTEGGSHRDVVVATGRFAPGECEGEELYEVRHPTYTHWVTKAELRRIKK